MGPRHESPPANFKFQGPFHHTSQDVTCCCHFWTWQCSCGQLAWWYGWYHHFWKKLGTNEDPFKPNSAKREGYKFASYSQVENQKIWINPGFCSEYYLDLIGTSQKPFRRSNKLNHRFPTGAQFHFQVLFLACMTIFLLNKICRVSGHKHLQRTELQNCFLWLVIATFIALVANGSEGHRQILAGVGWHGCDTWYRQLI